MCLGAIYWSRISKVYYAADREDAMHAGFSDKMIYDELAKPMKERNLQMVQIEPEATITLFKKWKLKSDKKPY
jgi:tRNA(Arg) A34 adenosine deaminase TadA